MLLKWDGMEVSSGKDWNIMQFLSAYKSGFEELAENATVSERLLYGLKVCLIGMLIVFAVLAILCGVLYLFKLYYKLSQKKKAPSTAPVENPAPAAAGVTEDEELTVAIATAAIAAARNDSDAAFKVISIKKID